MTSRIVSRAVSMHRRRKSDAARAADARNLEQRRAAMEAARLTEWGEDYHAHIAGLVEGASLASQMGRS